MLARAEFVPEVIWVDDPLRDGLVAVSRSADPVCWQAAVDADAPVVTQVDDGTTAVGAIGRWPSSSISQPSLVRTMLDILDVRPGQRVLEIGTGSGWNAALLCGRAGNGGRVVSVEVDPVVADRAHRALDAAGCAPLLVVGDGLRGHPGEAPYDRVIATAAVRAIPPEWLEQTRTGGIIVAPWGTDYCDGALLVLTKNADGSASGRCGMNVGFMRVRAQRRAHLEPADTERSAARRSATSRNGGEILDMITFSRAAFIIGLRIPNCQLTVDEISKDHSVIELHDSFSHSWARIDVRNTADPFAVRESGPRRLWNEVERAYEWWLAAGEPGPEEVGLTVAGDGTHLLTVGPDSWRFAYTP